MILPIRERATFPILRVQRCNNWSLSNGYNLPLTMLPCATLMPSVSACPRRCARHVLLTSLTFPLRHNRCRHTCTLDNSSFWRVRPTPVQPRRSYSQHWPLLASRWVLVSSWPSHRSASTRATHNSEHTIHQKSSAASPPTAQNWHRHYTEPP